MVSLIKRPTDAWCSPDLVEKGFGQVVVARFKLSGAAKGGMWAVQPS
jgi:hypothetical protein